jgi:hypothetical protein
VLCFGTRALTLDSSKLETLAAVMAILAPSAAPRKVQPTVWDFTSVALQALEIGRNAEEVAVPTPDPRLRSTTARTGRRGVAASPKQAAPNAPPSPRKGRASGVPPD